MTNKELVVALAERLNITQKEASNLLQSYVDEVCNNLDMDKSVAFLNAGTFEVKMKEQRLSVNPKTKARLLVPPKLVLNFTLIQLLKNKLKNLQGDE